jgi:hypothetical protein
MGLERGFQENGGLEGREELVRKLLGSPALVKSLVGVERDVAVSSYVGGLKELFLAGTGLAVIMVAVQAGTGWRMGVVAMNGADADEGPVVGNGRGVVDERWEEGVEQGV